MTRIYPKLARNCFIFVSVVRWGFLGEAVEVFWKYKNVEIVAQKYVCVCGSPEALCMWIALNNVALANVLLRSHQFELFSDSGGSYQAIPR